MANPLNVSQMHPAPEPPATRVDVEESSYSLVYNGQEGDPVPIGTMAHVTDEATGQIYAALMLEGGDNTVTMWRLTSPQTIPVDDNVDGLDKICEENLGITFDGDEDESPEDDEHPEEGDEDEEPEDE